jgi:hypothetical protein
MKSKTVFHSLLLERVRDPEWLAGYTPEYLRVFVRKSPGVERNTLISVDVQEIKTDAVAGDVFFVGRPSRIEGRSGAGVGDPAHTNKSLQTIEI